MRQPLRLLKQRDVTEKTGKSRADIYADPNFPKPVKTGAGGKAVAWVEHEVDGYIEGLIATRDAKAAK